MVLGGPRAVVNGHGPAAEVHHARTGGAVDGVERSFVEHPVSRQKRKERSGRSASPRLSFLPERLRRVACGRRVPLRWAAGMRGLSPDRFAVLAVLVA